MVVVVAVVVAVVVVGGEGNGEVQEMVVGEEEEEVVTATAPQPLSSLDTFTYGKKIQKKKYSTTLSSCIHHYQLFYTFITYP